MNELDLDLDTVFSIKTDTINIWRCTKCKKWSHAQKRPNNHQRFVKVEDMPDTDPETVPENIIEEQFGYEDPGSESLVGWIIECGPFEHWVAHKV